MQVHHGINNLPAFKHAVLTTGMFDGVHIAHQRLLSKITTKAKEQNGESVLISFWPHPQMVLGAIDRPPIQLLNTLEEKIENLSKTQLDHLVIMPFDTSFSLMSAEDYIEKFLVANFHPKTIVIGYNHRFGNQRKGDIHLLLEMGNKHQFSVLEFDQQVEDSISVSSTNVRKSIVEGNVAEAQLLLGRPYSLSGSVVKGQQLGRTIQFPTANIQLSSKDKLLPKIGVYCVSIRIDDKIHFGMMNIGKRPTVAGQDLTLEVHILNFEKEIYIKDVTVFFHHRLRDEIKFNSLEDLKNQLELDKKVSEEYFKKN